MLNKSNIVYSYKNALIIWIKYGNSSLILEIKIKGTCIALSCNIKVVGSEVREPFEPTNQEGIVINGRNSIPKFM